MTQQFGLAANETDTARDTELMCALSALLENDFSNGWRNMANTYVMRNAKDSTAQRQETLVKFIEEHL